MDDEIATVLVTDAHSQEREAEGLTRDRAAVLQDVLLLYAERLQGLI